MAVDSAGRSPGLPITNCKLQIIFVTMARKTHVHGHVAHKHPLLKAALKKHPSLRKNFCFGCGKDNPEGMRLRFHHDKESNRFVALSRLPRRFTGPPRHAHGGVIAAILDEAMS